MRKRNKIAVIALASFLLMTGCGTPTTTVGSSPTYSTAPNFQQVSGTNIFFTCHGTTGIYMRDTNVFAVPHHEKCEK